MPAHALPKEISVSELRTLRTQAQGLHVRLSRVSLVDAVRAVCGINAQLRPAMLLALRARIGELQIEDVEAAIATGHILVRTWVMRSTLHLLPAEDLRWLVSLLGPIFIPKGKRRRLQLGLDEETTAKGLNAIRAILKRTDPLTRGEVVERLADRGVVLDRRSQAPIHLIACAALSGLVCLGADREKNESAYVLVDNWLDRGKLLSRETALATLARRYLEGYGPASPKDFAAWSGLTLGDAKQGWELLRGRDELIEVNVEGLTLWSSAAKAKPLSRSTRSSSAVRLLPAFDTYLLGYSDRDHVVPPKYQHQVYHGGQVVPVVLVDGAAAGVWRYERKGKRLNITVRPFESFSRSVQQLIAEEAEDVGRFFDSPVALSYSQRGW